MLAQVAQGQGQQQALVVVLQGPLHQPRFEPRRIQHGLPAAHLQMIQQPAQVLGQRRLALAVGLEQGWVEVQLPGHELHQAVGYLPVPLRRQVPQQPQHAQLHSEAEAVTAPTLLRDQLLVGGGEPAAGLQVFLAQVGGEGLVALALQGGEEVDGHGQAAGGEQTPV